MVSTEGLKYYYQKNQVFDFPDMEIGQGESMLILGRSGIGKTTLLHLLAGLMKPLEGRVLVGKEDLAAMDSVKLDRYRGENISIIFQQNHFIKSLTVWENLKVAQEFGGRKFDKTLAEEYLRKLGIYERRNKYTYHLSEGEKQRVAIVRALINKPKVILADEPTSALDDYNAQEVGSLLLQQAKDVNAALLIVTHDGRLKTLIDQSIILS